MKTTRRQFAQIAAVAVPLMAMHPDALMAADPPKKPAPATPLSDAQKGLVEAEYGKFLSPEEMKTVATDFQESAPFLAKFRAFALKNSDEPDFNFNPLVRR